MNRRTSWLPGVLALAGVCLGGCSGSGEVLRSDDSVVLVGADGDGDNAAGVGFGGNVTMVGACLGIEASTVIWPHGTSIVSEHPLVVDVTGLGEIRVGDQVSGGGVQYADHLPDGIDAIPSECPSGSLFAFFPE